MPPTKRPLAQTDTNARLPPNKKHKEKDVISGDDYESKSREELVGILKERSKPSSGTKDTLIRRLRENEESVAHPTPEKTKRRRSARIEAANHDAKINESRKEGLKSVWAVKNKALVTPSSPVVEKPSAISSRGKVPAPQENADGNQIDFRTKDNSKLRALLRDWRVMQPREVEDMSRMAMIERLERHKMRGYGDDYESLTCSQLSALLSTRLLSTGATKAAQIVRLRYDDALDRDNGNTEERSLYTHITFHQLEVQRYEALMDWVLHEEGWTYQDLEVTGLRILMDLRQHGKNVISVCDDSELIDWLEEDDKKMAQKNKVEITTLWESEFAAELEHWKKKLADARADLESKIGHPLPDPVPIFERSKYDVPTITRNTDRGVLAFDAKKTNWGLFNVTDLWRICLQKGAPGVGSRDVMIKWLETGVMEYEDMNFDSLRVQCWNRLIPQYSKDDKASLVKKLRLMDKVDEERKKSPTPEASEVPGVGGNDEGHREQSDLPSQMIESSTTDTAFVDGSVYAKKDNSMLRTLLRDRHLQISGTREEMIHRLETSPYNYSSYSSEELSLILKDRHFTNASHGDKETKIKRLENSDEALYDSSNLKDTQLYVRAELREEQIEIEEEALKALSGSSVPYEDLEDRVLRELASALGLSTYGEAGALLKRLKANEQKTTLKGKDKTTVHDAIEKLTMSLKAHRESYDQAKKELEESVGHPVLDVSAVMKQYNTITHRDSKIVSSYRPTHTPGPLCDYDWKASHWAGRSERELRDICQRRGMEGWGTKATAIKWLETGSVDYEDLSGTSLEQMCWKRGVKVKHNEKRLDLVKKLRDTDEKEIKYKDLGVMALRKLCKERGIDVKAGEPKRDLVTRLRQADESNSST